MDIDHEAHKHEVPPSTIEGEAERAEAESPSKRIQEVLDEAKKTIKQGDGEDSAGPSRAEEPDAD